MKIKPEIVAKVIQAASILLGIAGTVVAGKVEANHRAAIKAQVKADILKELSEKK